MPLSPEDSAPLYVEMMGGAKKIMNKGKKLYDQGKYFYAIEILNKLVYAEPENEVAKDLLADVFEQIGYQKESPSVRNTFLAAAFELRHGMPSGASPKADLTITINRSELDDELMGKTSFDDKIKEGKAKLKGNRKPYDELGNMLTTFTMEFELLPGTLPDDAGAASANENPFRQKAPASSAGAG